MKQLKSAYFPEDSYTTLIESDTVQHKDVYPKINSSVQNRIEFPISRDILWDRRAISELIVISCIDCIPPIYITTRVIDRIIEDSKKFVTNYSYPPPRYTSDFFVRSNWVHLMPADERLSLRCWPGVRKGRCGLSYFLEMRSLLDAQDNLGDVRLNTSILNVPVSWFESSNAQLSFSGESTSHLIENLDKALHSSRDFSLKACIRIRAGATVRQPSQRSLGPNVVTVRFEAIQPNNSFKFSKIHPLPILSTTLSNQLFASPPEYKSTSYNHTSTNNHHKSTCLSYDNFVERTGYLTLNQTRKAVLLLESDPAITLAPIVGIWVSLPTLPDQEARGSAGPEWALSHPFVWATCARFQHKIDEGVGSGISDVVLADPRQPSFLLGLFLGGTCSHFFEVASVLSTAPYACSDFMVDLVPPVHPDEPPQPLLCRFRPLVHSDLVENFDRAVRAANDLHVHHNRNHKLPPPSNSMEKTASRVVLEEVATPAPRVSASLPSPVPMLSPEVIRTTNVGGNGSFGQLGSVSELVGGQTASVPLPSLPSSPTHLSGAACSRCALLADALQSEQSQRVAMQAEIDDLRAQVKHLRAHLEVTRAAQITDVARTTTPLVHVEVQTELGSDLPLGNTGPEPPASLVSDDDNIMRIPVYERNGSEKSIQPEQSDSDHVDEAMTQVSLDKCLDDDDGFVFRPMVMPAFAVDAEVMAAPDTFTTRLEYLDPALWESSITLAPEPKAAIDIDSPRSMAVEGVRVVQRSGSRRVTSVDESESIVAIEARYLSMNTVSHKL